MKNLVEGAMGMAKEIKKSVQEKWKMFKEKFDGTKNEMAKEVAQAESPEDLIAAGEKLIEQGKALKAEKQEVQEEENFEKESNLAEEELAVTGNNERISESIDKGERIAAQDTAEKQATWEEEKKTAAEYAAKSKASDEAKIAKTLAKLNVEKSESTSAEKTEAVKPEKAEPAKQESIKNDPEYKQLKLAFDERNRGNYSAAAEERWEDLSRELLPKLNTIADIKEAEFHLSGKEKDIAKDRWDKLSEKEVQGANSEEEMLEAVKNIRSGGYADLLNLKEQAFNKFPNLKKHFPHNFSRSDFRYLSDIEDGD